MGTLIDDEMLDAFAIVAEPDDVANRLVERFGGTIDRVASTFRFVSDAQQKSTLATLHGAS